MENVTFKNYDSKVMNYIFRTFSTLPKDTWNPEKSRLDCQVNIVQKHFDPYLIKSLSEMVHQLNFWNRVRVTGRLFKKFFFYFSRFFFLVILRKYNIRSFETTVDCVTWQNWDENWNWLLLPPTHDENPTRDDLGKRGNG